LSGEDDRPYAAGVNGVKGGIDIWYDVIMEGWAMMTWTTDHRQNVGRGDEMIRAQQC
jgi:hypothetical protein